ncbi:hypothetical protein T4B_9206 [Trichinella pseudospiralis]|uniref:Uncharacterized protein n=1 Tax=Trichinella pseudospiralis TaxID=6337 RepID=A0A0V1HPH7_TRIPS|nr:hypothetical protein T4B_9206 [Trichinella pseudospiralis]
MNVKGVLNGNEQRKPTPRLYLCYRRKLTKPNLTKLRSQKLDINNKLHLTTKHAAQQITLHNKQGGTIWLLKL